MEGAKPARHAKTQSFFSPANPYGQSETVLREERAGGTPASVHYMRG